jgi:hypothetical protein
VRCESRVNLFAARHALLRWNLHQTFARANRADPLSRISRCVAAAIHAAFISLNAG